MIICIDSGNSRIKWGAYADGRWQASGAVTHDEIACLAELPNRFTARQVYFCNVAGTAAGTAIRDALTAWQTIIVEARSSAAACGVRNTYDNPLQLGVDRWHALIGARSLTRNAALVVMAGTATTIDTLDAEGNFQGGLILPGIDLMRRALSRDTAALPFAQGKHAAWPKNTDDAIVSGCLEAQAGAIERAFARTAPEDAACCLISGGAAAQLTPLLGIPYQMLDNLVLEGLLQQATCAEQQQAS
jgi:type III pantothenate kinase